MAALVFTLTQVTTNNEELRRKDEIEALSGKILKHCTDDTLRLSVNESLCSYYLYKPGDIEKAARIAESLPKFSYGREFLAPYCIDGDDRLRAFQDMILEHTHVVIGAIRCVIENDKNLTANEKIALYEKANALYELLFDGENDYDLLTSNCINIASLYVEIGEQSKAIRSLKQAVEYAARFDNIPNGKSYTTLLLNRLTQGYAPEKALQTGTRGGIVLSDIVREEIKSVQFEGLFGLSEYAN
jgi:tetratricopeptide (TPR) repeat protein